MRHLKIVPNCLDANHVSSDDSFIQDTVDFFLRKNQGHMHKWLYGVNQTQDDLVKGSDLWGDVYLSPKYYLPRYETDTIKKFHHTLLAEPTLINALSKVTTVYDLGPGSIECIKAKAVPILEHISDKSIYRPVDLSEDFIGYAEETVKTEIPMMRVRGCIEDFEHPSKNYSSENGLVLFFGSTMFNIPCSLSNNFPFGDLLEKFISFKSFIKSGYLISTQDITNDETILHDAYNCIEHKRFVQNLPYRIARDCKILGNFKPDKWMYHSIWRPENYQFAHCLIALEPQSFSIEGKYFTIREGQSFVTHNSFKCPTNILIEIAKRAGFKSEKLICDDRFALHLFSLN